MDIRGLPLPPAGGLGAGPLSFAEVSIESAREWALRSGLRVWAEIDLDRIEANVRALIAREAAPRLLAVVKGNAYGHGATAVGKAALAAGAWGLGVIGVEEGEVLRRNGIDAPVLVLGSISPGIAPRVVAASLRATVASMETARALSDAAVAAGREAIVHIKVETGLNRYGLLPAEAVAFAEAVRELPGVVVEGLSTHFAAVDEGDKEFTFRQYFAFRDAADKLPWIPVHHLSSTGGILDLPELGLGMVRAGIGVYGYYPSEFVSRGVALSPVLQLRTRVARVQRLQPGEYVGYARTWQARRPSVIATIMAGYADGIHRILSNRGFAIVQGRRAPFAGRVAMDMLMLDVTDIPGVAVEDEVTLIGEQGSESIWADEVAALSETISYEVLASLSSRVVRLYTRGGRLVACEDLEGYRELSTP
ncbi:MAG TPA: alanine racemase [Dehalococcoidia bacterium]|nr:alanine racemase [Dehalococcoidia bacterium]